MSWKEHDEWIDLVRGRHTVLYRNSDTGAVHHLIYDFHLPACPHCGAVKVATAEPVDFHTVKANTLATLNAHHQRMLKHKENHSRVRTGSGPK